jgi:hypothetical protein
MVECCSAGALLGIAPDQISTTAKDHQNLLTESNAFYFIATFRQW